MIIMIMIGYAHDGYDVDWLVIERMTDMFMVRVIMEVILIMTPLSFIVTIIPIIFITTTTTIIIILINNFTSYMYIGSNGDPDMPSSLHYISPVGVLNPYQAAILSVARILEHYDR